ncbi:RrF2 family transcriptional regulator [Prosthecomicrobium sp. N25]|uniref:RrF2 family transcriptional regulator n=1 Tax=Prosthecomicrobium sp. N25 TaxID=3129254 RepID=UPI003076DE92
MISQKARYAFKALIALAREGHGASLQAREISSRESIPQSFLEQILLDLKRAGIVGSRRGREGGYTLIKDPTTVSFGQVLRLIDGPVAPLPCLSRTAYRRCEDCADETRCELRRVFAKIYDAQVDLLDHTSIGDALLAGPTPDLLSPFLEKAS